MEQPPVSRCARMAPYHKGWRYCRECECRFLTEAKFCPCCQAHLRAKKRRYGAARPEVARL